MRFDVTQDLRAATLLSALGLDPRQVMTSLGQLDPGGLDLLGDSFQRVGNLGPQALFNLMQRGSLAGLRMPLPFEARRSLRGWPEPEEGFDPDAFPSGSSGQRLARLFRNDPFARQQIERALGGRIVPSSLSPGGFRVQRFAPGAFPGGGVDNLAALQAYSMLAGIDRGATMFQPAAFGAENAFQTMMMGAFGMMALQQAERLQQQQQRRNFRILDTADLLGINPDGTPRGGSGNAIQAFAPAGAGFQGGGFPGGFGGFGGAPSPTQQLFGLGGGGDTGAVLADPGLTVEDKVTLLIMMIMKKMDQDIERQANYINALQQQQNGGGKGGKGGGGGGAPSIDVETMKLKRLIDKRSQMFDMLRQIIDKYNQTAKGIIDSMGR